MTQGAATRCIRQVNKKESSLHAKARSYAKNYGAGGGGRTRTLLPERDFESRASANSTTPAKTYLDIISYFIVRVKG